MSGAWSAADEAQLEEMLRRRKASFEVLSGAVWSGVAPHVTDHAEAEKLTNAVVEVLLREGRQVGPLFRMFDPTNNGEADGWKRVIMTEELYDRICALHKKRTDTVSWEKALEAVVIVGAQLADYFANGAIYCQVKPGGGVTPCYPGGSLPDPKGWMFNPTPDEFKALETWGVKKQLSATGILRQALRMYDTVERALEDPRCDRVSIDPCGGKITVITKDAS